MAPREVITLTLPDRELRDLSNKFSKKGRKEFLRGAETILLDHGVMMFNEIRSRISANPFLIETGSYRDSWQWYNEDNKEGTELTFFLFSDHPAANRLEYGFVGVDSEGRRYSTPPRPHVRPTYERIFPLYTKALDDYIAEWLNSDGLMS